MKRPYVRQSLVWVLTPLVLLALLLFWQLPGQMPVVVGNAPENTAGVCTRFSLDQGANASTGASVAGRYEMREAFSGRLLATWTANASETNSGWLTDLPQVHLNGSWVEVQFYAQGSETAVLLGILNPAPGTAYGWVANDQCHAVELQFPEDWQATRLPEMGNGGIGGGTQEGNNERGQTVVDNGSDDRLADLQQDWTPNLDGLTAVANAQISQTPAFLQAENLGAWQDGERLGYGFTLINPSQNHVVADVQYEVRLLDESQNVVNSFNMQLRDLYPGEVANVGKLLGLSMTDGPIATIEIEFANTASQIATSAQPQPLRLVPPSPPFGSNASVSVTIDELSGEDLDTFHLDIDLLNPNGTFIARNVFYRITAYNADDTILVNFQGAGGDVYPRQHLTIAGEAFLPDPDQLTRVEVQITPERFEPIDPTNLPINLIPSEQVVFVNQHASFSWKTQTPGSFPVQEFKELGTADVVVIAYDEDGAVIGGGHQILSNRGDLAGVEAGFVPIRASQLPTAVSLFVDVDYLDDLPPRGGGGNHIGRDNFPIVYLGVTVQE